MAGAADDSLQHGARVHLSSHSIQDSSETKSKKKQRDIIKLNITRLVSLNARKSGDTNRCDIWGIAVTSTGHLLIADNTYKTVKILSPDNKLLSLLSLSSIPTDSLSNCPTGITIINDKTAAVCTDDGEIHILDIADPAAPFFQRSIPLGYDVTGMTLCINNLVVLCWGESEGIKLIDFDGQALWSVTEEHEGRQLFQSSRAAATRVFNDKTTIVVTDPDNDKLTVYDASDGDLITSVDVTGKGPHGVTTDGEGNIFVCYKTTGEICVWSADLTKCRVILTSSDLHGDPLVIVYSNSLNRLFISYESNDTVDQFQLS